MRYFAGRSLPFRSIICGPANLGTVVLFGVIWHGEKETVPTYTFSDAVDLEVRTEYDLQGIEYEFRETVRVRIHGNRQVDSL